MTRVLVLSPHPDDESIGCGGTLRRHVAGGDRVEVVFLTSGEKGGHGRGEEETRRTREQEARDAAQILGVAELEFWRQPDGAFAASDEMVDRLERKLRQFAPDVVYVTHDGEAHPDHRAAVELVRRALDRQGDDCGRRPAVLMYEVWTPIQRIDHVEDISEHIEYKLRAIRAHQCQCDVMAFDEAFLGLARYRGEMHSWPGGDYAEVFTRLDPTR